MSKKLIFLNTHPIQYFAPLYRKIAKNPNFDLEVWYASHQGLKGEVDRQFGTTVKWDIPILDGYKSHLFQNYSFNPGFYNGFWGLMNFGIFKALKTLPPKSNVVIHGWYPFVSIFAIISSKVCGHATCLRAETPLLHELQNRPFKLFIRKIFLKYFLFQFIDRFLYIGQQNKNLYKYYGINEAKLLFTPYAVDNEFFQAETNRLKKNELKLGLGIPEQAKVILFSGKLIKKKNPLDLLEAYAQLPEKSNIHLIFMGDGELRTVLESFIEKKKLKNVILTGFINQSKIAEYYQIADLFVMCSGLGETWGLSINEAMNFGLPVVVSDMVGSANDLVINGENGFIFPENNIKELSNSINKLLSNPDLMKSAGIKSKEIIDNYSFDQIIESLEKI